MKMQSLKFAKIFLLLPLIALITAPIEAQKIPDTGQCQAYNNSKTIALPTFGQTFFGQDANYAGNLPAYRDNGDGTVSDLVTGLMWSKAVVPKKLSLDEALISAEKLVLGGHNDWRVPKIKELYSLIDFRGYTGHGASVGQAPANAIPFINTDYFDFAYGDSSSGERYIDAQWLSSTRYVSTTMSGSPTLFGVNFADGRIKGYGYRRPDGSEKKFYVRYVRGPAYGENDFVDNQDQTITDRATGLMWMKIDSGRAMSWQEALQYAENLEFAGYNDWRLPDAKELQSIVDYRRAPDITDSAAIDAIFSTTSIINEAGRKDYPYFWTSTTHLDGPAPGKAAAYIAFGRALGRMHGAIIDVHGAGAQRSDPKSGIPTFRGPQGDAVRIKNYVRCVRGGGKTLAKNPASASSVTNYPQKVRIVTEAGKAAGKNKASAQKKPPAGRRADHRQHFIERLDKDGDNRVSRREFDGPPHRFNFHDQNRDGYIELNEAPQGPPPRPGGY